MISSSTHYLSFLAAVEEGTITAAAARLGLPRPTVSRHLARLESDLGVGLLHRSTREVSPTAAGRRLYERIQPLVHQWEDAEHAAREDGDAVVGLVRVSVLPLVAPSLTPVVHRIHEQHPRLTVEVVANVGMVDLRGDFDVAIWGGQPRDPDLVVRTLATARVGMVASPGYLRRRGTPTSVEDLGDHDLLRGHGNDGKPGLWWPLRSGGRMRVEGRFITNDALLLKACAIAGQGIAFLSDLNCAEAFQDGRLVSVLPEVVGHTGTLRIMFAERTRMPARTRVFIDAVTEAFDRVHGVE